MTITQDDFKKIWASTSSVPEYTFSDSDYQDGWEFVGNLPPTRAMWDTLQRRNDQKMKYLQDNGSMCFDSVADMVATDLEAGQTTFTKGYSSVNDGGASVYTIRAKTQGDVDDGGSVIFLDNGNVAELIIDNKINVKQFGMIADYVGTPNYDGNDTITCTDNTPALQSILKYCETHNNVVVYFPAGHYGFTTGKINVDLDTNDLTIVGDGMGVTILDYVKEDNTHDDEADPYVSELMANYIFKVESANNINFKDITLKATTKRDHGAHKIYAGAVWGIVLSNANNIICENVEVAHFAYRGISIGNQYRSEYMVDNVELINCYGHDNSSTGFWVSCTKLLRVVGGEYSYNGVRGEDASGYAFAMSNYCGKMIVTNAFVHNNYQNGIDGHSCCDAIIKGCTFKDNIGRSIGLQGWSISQYDEGTSIDVIDCDFFMGDTDEGEDFIKDSLQESIVRGSYPFYMPKIMHLADNDNNNVSSGILKSINIINANIYGAYNGTDVKGGNYSSIDINGINADVMISDCTWNFNKFIRGQYVTSQSMIIPFNIVSKKITMQNCYYNLPNQLHSDSYGTGFINIANGFVYDINLKKCLFETYDALPLYYGGGSDSSVMYDPTGWNIHIEDVTVNYQQSFAPKMNNFMTFDEAFSSVPIKYIKNYKIKDIAHDRVIHPRQPINTNSPFSVSKTFNFVGGVSADTDFFSIVLSSVGVDRVFDVTLIDLYGSVVDTEIVKVAGLWIGATVFSAGTKFTYSSISSFTDVDGITKRKVTFKSTAYINNAVNISVTETAFGYTHGVEDIVKES